ncbi:MAG TPA: hypothetical protein DCL73_01610 [Treponema sp.]|nr:hypothetical protein [Treponema sp.]
MCNVDTDRKYTLHISSTGNFSRTGLPSGTYRLVKFYTKFTDAGASSEHTLTLVSGEYCLEIQEEVTNLGKLEWTSDYKTNQGDVRWNRNYSDVHVDFVNHHSDSALVYARWSDAAVYKK